MEQKNAEISALEAQIDPHFLYNILDTINWKAIENEQYEISEMLVALADILRYAINDAGEFTTIDAEKGWLEKIHPSPAGKTGEEIELEFKIQDSYGKCKIHKMLLQPFVENAIKYSFRGYEGAHRLTIEVSKAEEQMHIIIANNGRHIEEDQLKDLNMGKEIKNHFGISNVRKRLKLYYGEDAVIYFENVSPSGVKVHLFVPLQEEQKMKIAVVEDEKPIREGLVHILNKISPEYQVVGSAENGAEGLILLEEEMPDLIMLDIQMPDMDGLQMLKEARARGIYTKVIILTAYSDFSYAKKSNRTGN